MGEKVLKLPETWEATLVEENRMLKGFIGNTTTDRIKQLEQAERELSVVKAQNVEKDNQIAAIKEQSDKRIEDIKKYYERQMELERNAVRRDTKSNESKKTRQIEKEKEQVVKERDTYKEQLKQLQESLDEANNKLDILVAGQAEAAEKLQNLIIGLLEIKQLLEFDKPKKEIIQQIDKIISVGERKSKEENIAEIQLIYELTQQGLTNKEIAGRLGWKSARGSVKVTEKRKTKAYMELENKKIKNYG